MTNNKTGHLKAHFLLSEAKNRNNLSVAQKIETILYADDYPKLSHIKIPSNFSTKFGLKVPIGRSNIGQIIKNRPTY